MEYKVVKSTDIDFESVCARCEKDIVEENLVRNGGTLHFQFLTYQADCIIIALDDSSMVGFNALIINSSIGFYVNQIAVRKNYQKKGIGTTLISMGKEMADSLSLPVYAHVREYNVGSQKTFEKCGFKRENTYRTQDSFFYAYSQKKKGEKKEK